MQLRWGLGPVFAYEWLAASRRWQMYAMRSLFVTGLLIALTLVWYSEVRGQRRINNIQGYARVGQQFGQMVTGAQLGLVLLLVPAFTAGAVCSAKAQGSLLHLLVTDLSNVEIVVGKLAARLVPLVGLLGCSLPILLLATLFGGIDPQSLVGAFLVILGVIIASCTLTLAISVWATRTYEVIIAAYLCWGLLLFAYPVAHAVGWYWDLGDPVWINHFQPNPFGIALALFEGLKQPDLGDSFRYLGSAVVISAALVGLAIATVRAAAVRHMTKAAGRRRWKMPSLRRLKDWLPAPPLDSHPVLWREWKGRRGATWARVVWCIYFIVALVMMVKTFDSVAHRGFYRPIRYHERTEYLYQLLTGNGENCRQLALVVGLLVVIGLFLVSLTSVSSLAEERAQGSLDLLLLTPLSTSSILRDKWRSAYGAVLLLAFLPLALFGAQLWIGGNWFGTLLFLGWVLGYGAVTISLALALGTWIARPRGAITLNAIINLLVQLAGSAVVVFWRPDNGSQYVGITDVFGYDLDEYHLFTFYYVVATGTCLSLHVVLTLATMATFDRCLGRVRVKHEHPLDLDLIKKLREANA